MAWAPLLLAVLAHTSGSLVQAALTQPASVSANPGETVEITCSGGDYDYGWYKQKSPGGSPVTVTYRDTNRPSDIPSRFSGSKSGSTATLTITGVQAEDEAVYFCGSWDGSTGTGIFGAGTTLTVLGQPKSGPAGQGMAAPCGRPGLPAPPPPPAGPGPSSAPGPRVCFAAGPDGADGAAVGAEEAAGARRGGKVTVRYDRRELRKRLHLEEWILGQLTALYDCREEEIPELEIDVDELLEMESDGARSARVQEILVDCYKPTEAFVCDLLDKIRGMQKLNTPQKK